MKRLVQAPGIAPGTADWRSAALLTTPRLQKTGAHGASCTRMPPRAAERFKLPVSAVSPRGQKSCSYLLTTTMIPAGRLALPRLTASEAGQSARFPINQAGESGGACGYRARLKSFLPGRRPRYCSPRPQRDLAAAAGSAPAPVGFKGRRAPVTPRRSKKWSSATGSHRASPACHAGVFTGSLADESRRMDLHHRCPGGGAFTARCIAVVRPAPGGRPLGSPLASARGCAISALSRSVCHVSENGSATGTCAPLAPIPTGCVALYALAE